MNWPLKLQGRFLTEMDVVEIRSLLDGNPSWNRSRLFREVCELWDWRHPDGQLKDMVCRKLSALQPIKIIDAKSSADNEKIFNYLVKEYHFLSFGRPVGQNCVTSFEMYKIHDKVYHECWLHIVECLKEDLKFKSEHQKPHEVL